MIYVIFAILLALNIPGVMDGNFMACIASGFIAGCAFTLFVVGLAERRRSPTPTEEGEGG